MSEDDVGEEVSLRAVVESLLKSRPDMATADRAPARPTPEERFLWFVLDLGVGLWPAIFMAAIFPRFPLPILPLIVLVGFFASPHLFKAERPGARRAGRSARAPGCDRSRRLAAARNGVDPLLEAADLVDIGFNSMQSHHFGEVLTWLQQGAEVACAMGARRQLEMASGNAAGPTRTRATSATFTSPPTGPRAA